MFEKPLTPSDVGKLNRLVIPKQYAEKYFPLDSESGEKGLLLNFEDESGKAWRFRYSYWTSSQSYVLTKGWSRYVKEKRLEAGDVVYFERIHGIDGTGDRLYIMWRKRGSSANAGVLTGPVSTTEPWSPAASNGSYPASPVSSGYNPYSTTPVQQDHYNYFLQGMFCFSVMCLLSFPICKFSKSFFNSVSFLSFSEAQFFNWQYLNYVYCISCYDY